MDNRREFLKKALLLTGAAGMSSTLPASIKRALEINPEIGSTYQDAEHVVILMQENRSFDHVFGTLRGVRGFNDPKAVRKPDGNPVWLQQNKNGETYAPFHFGIKETKITWMGSLPHSRSSQVDAYNLGRYDNWLTAKKPGNKNYAHMPLTMGHFNRNDLAFDYAFADAFTVCDQHFCSAMTSTWPNRLYLWGGTIREQKSIDAKAYVRNNIPWGEAAWQTFPETLQKNGISWKVYQNALSIRDSYKGEERSWLANFGCNPLEFQAQFNARFADAHIESLQRKSGTLKRRIQDYQKRLDGITQSNEKYTEWKGILDKSQSELKDVNQQLKIWTKENYNKLSDYEKDLFNRAFVTNKEAADYLELSTLEYEDSGKKHTIPIPKGDVLHQFRKDVDSGNLPAVSWLVPSQKLSGHPSAPWYGTWFTSEILNILTKNPEVWKKTIFILTYDENDGYYDHVVPFTAPDVRDPKNGKVSDGLDIEAEYIKLENELAQGIKKGEARGGAIGLGNRVPMVVASPWSRGGKVCSQVLDATSVLQFLEIFLSKKYNKEIKQEVITGWRRAVCGDLTSVFDKYDGKEIKSIPFIDRNPFVETIYDAQFTEEPHSYKALTQQEIEEISKNAIGAKWQPRQEPGIKPACPLPYQLYAEAEADRDRKAIRIHLEASDEVFGKRAQGSPFIIYAPGNKNNENGRAWNFAVKAGDAIDYEWQTADFDNGIYHLIVHGPNGFYREVLGNDKDPDLIVKCDYQRGRKGKTKGNVELFLTNNENRFITAKIKDNAYGNQEQTIQIKPNSLKRVVVNLMKSHNWYDFTVTTNENSDFSRRYAGRVETGVSTYTDPVMGG